MGAELAQIMSTLHGENSPVLKALNDKLDTVTACLSSSTDCSIPQSYPESTSSTKISDDVNDELIEESSMQGRKGVSISSTSMLAYLRSTFGSKSQVKPCENRTESSAAWGSSIAMITQESNTAEENAELAQIMSTLDEENSPVLKALNNCPDTVTACLSSCPQCTAIPQEFLAKALLVGSGLGLESKKGRKISRRKRRTSCTTWVPKGLLLLT